MELQTVTIAKALKLKSSLARKISELDSKVIDNSYLKNKDSVRHHSSSDCLSTRRSLVEKMILYKIKIYKGNMPIQNDIYLLSELKSELALLKRINTTEGAVPKHYKDDIDRFYVVDIPYSQLQKDIENIQSTIDSIQDRIDYFNNTTKIEVPVF